MITQLHPTRRYNKYIGKPLYRFSRRHFGKSKILALGLADLPASILIGGGIGLISGDVFCGFYAAVLHQAVTTPLIYSIHNSNRRNRQRNLESLFYTRSF